MKIKHITALISIALLVSCSDNKTETDNESIHNHENENVVALNKKQIKALDLKLGNIVKRNLTTVIKTNGQLKIPPASTADVSAVMGGNVKKILVFHGDKAAKGQALAVLEHPDYITLQENFAETANKLVYLKKEYERQKELFDNQVGAGKDFQLALMNYKTAKAKYEGLKTRLLMVNLSPEEVKNGKISGSVAILSPINGYVNEIDIKTGSYVNTGDRLFELTDNSAIHADFSVYEKDIHLIKKGQTVHFSVSNQPENEYTAEIFAVEKEFKGNSKAVHIHAKINGTTDNLIPGMYISGHIHADTNYVNTLPDNAIVNDGAKSYVFVLKEENNLRGKQEFKLTEIITGRKDNGFTEVYPIDNLTDSCMVVLNAAYYLFSDLKKEETEHEH